MTLREKYRSLNDAAFVKKMMVSSVYGAMQLEGHPVSKKKIERLYAAEALLLGYVALTDQPASVKPLIPFPVHGKIDPFNVGRFALHIFFMPFRKDKKRNGF